MKEKKGKKRVKEKKDEGKKIKENVEGKMKEREAG